MSIVATCYYSWKTFKFLSPQHLQIKRRGKEPISKVARWVLSIKVGWYTSVHDFDTMKGTETGLISPPCHLSNHTSKFFCNQIGGWDLKIVLFSKNDLDILPLMYVNKIVIYLVRTQADILFGLLECCLSWDNSSSRKTCCCSFCTRIGHSTSSCTTNCNYHCKNPKPN